MADRVINIPIELVNYLGKKKVQSICREFLDNHNTKPIEKLVKEAEFKYCLLKRFLGNLKQKEADIAREHLMKANLEYSDAEPLYPDDCSEFNVPNM